MRKMRTKRASEEQQRNDKGEGHGFLVSPHADEKDRQIVRGPLFVPCFALFCFTLFPQVTPLDVSFHLPQRLALYLGSRLACHVYIATCAMWRRSGLSEPCRALAGCLLTHLSRPSFLPPTVHLRLRLPAQPLQVRNAGNGASDASSQYKRVSQKDHILLRPDTYIGSTEQHQEEMLVHDGQRFVHRKIAFVPGLFKIFDEILGRCSRTRGRKKDKLVMESGER